MDEPVLRLVAVLAVAVAAGVWGYLNRRGVTLGRRTVQVPSLGSGVYVFTAQTCGSCRRVTELVGEIAPGFEEVRYEDRPELFSSEGIDRVPVLMHLDEHGRGWKAEGIPGRRQLRRWLGG